MSIVITTSKKLEALVEKATDRAIHSSKQEILGPLPQAPYFDPNGMGPIAQGFAQLIASMGANQQLHVDVHSNAHGISVRVARVSTPPLVAPMADTADMSNRVTQEVMGRIQKLLENPRPTYSGEYKSASSLPAVIEGNDLYVINEHGQKVFVRKL